MNTNQSKKDYILKILNVMKPHLPNYDELFSMVNDDSVLDITLDAMINILNQGIRKVKNQRGKEVISKGLNMIQKIHQSEELSEIENKKELEELEKMIDQ